VDHSGAGYIIPAGIEGAAKESYCERMDALFALYARLTDAGVPREDARFVLPYSFRSNFYVTVNGRELVRMVSEMTDGRGAHIAELKYLGLQLRDQLEQAYPGIFDSERTTKKCAMSNAVTQFSRGQEKNARSQLICMTADPQTALSRAMEFSGRFEAEDGDFLTERNMMALVRDERPRELEFMGAQFVARNVSLACITHFTRHRMQSLLVPDVACALGRGDYVVPRTVRDSVLAAEYEAAFAAQAELAGSLLAAGLAPCDAGYLALAGHVMDIMFEMNGRELLHFLKLRTCNRAQWEIRAVAREMLEQLREKCDDIFWAYGPSCLVDGRCPEGRLSCGKPETR
jgi:thymidylate synthase (FAD)